MIVELILLAIGIILGVGIVTVIWVISDWLHARQEWRNELNELKES